MLKAHFGQIPYSLAEKKKKNVDATLNEYIKKNNKSPNDRHVAKILKEIEEN